MDYIKVAMPKGRIGELSAKLFESMGFEGLTEAKSSRKLIFTDEKNKIMYFMVKPSDVPVYVEYGSADIGIVGKDVLLEESKNLYEVLNLGFGNCKIVIAGPKELQEKGNEIRYKRVATKYPHIAREYYENKKNESVEIIKLNGSVELAPLAGLAEVIVDIVETGSTLKENGLVVLETIAPVSARLVVNRVSLKMKSTGIEKIIEGLKKQVKV